MLKTAEYGFVAPVAHGTATEVGHLTLALTDRTANGVDLTRVVTLTAVILLVGKVIAARSHRRHTFRDQTMESGIW